MKANEFVKKHGWEAVAQALKTTPENHDFQSTDLEPILAKDGSIVGFDCKVYTVDFIEVKRLIESWGFIQEFGGIEQCKSWYETSPFKRDKYMRELKQAIADVESCQ